MADYSNTTNSTIITASAEADSIYNSGATVTVQALGGDDTINNIGSYVTIDANKGNDSVDNSGSNVFIFGGSDYDTMLNSENATVTVSNGDDTINNTGKNVTIDGGLGDDSITNSGSNVSISGGTGSNVINVDGGSGVTVNVKNGDDSIYIGDEVSSITVQDFGENDEIRFENTITNFSTISGGVKADNVTIAGLTAASSTQTWSGTTKYVEKISAGASLSSNSIVYAPASETTLFTISGITSTSKITVDTENKYVTIGAGALTTSNVSISDDYTLVLGDDISASATTSGWSSSGTTYSYKDVSTVAGYELVNNQIIYTPAVDGTTFVQLSGLKSEPTIDGNTVSLSPENFSTNVTVNSNTQNYAFNLGEGSYSKKSFIATANADSIYNSGSSLSISGGEGSDFISNSGSQVTISGGNGVDTINNEGSKVTINGDAGNDYISNSGDNVSINGGAGNDSIDFDSGSNVTIDVGSGNDTINLGDVASFNVNSFAAGDAIELSRLADSLGTVKGGITTGDVTIKGITSLSTTTNQWSLKSDVATYSQKITAGATLTEDESAIIYATASTSSLFTVKGVTSTVGIDVDDTTVTISKSALGTSNVSISNGYTLALGDDVGSATVGNAWIQNGTTYAYKTNTTTAGYELDRVNNVINYTAAKGGKTVAELTNLKISDNEPTVTSDSIEISANIFSGNVSVKSNSGKYKFELNEGNYSKKSFNGSGSADSIYNNGSSISISSGAGNDFISNESTGSNVTINGATGNDIISNNASKVTINGDAGNDSIGNWGEKVSINAGAGADSIYNGANTVTVLGGLNNDYIENVGSNVLFQYSGGSDTIKGFSSTDTLQMLSSSIKDAYSNGSDAFLIVGSNTITVEDLSTNTLNVMNSKGSLSSYTISLVKGTDSVDYLPNYNSNVSIQALAASDDIDNFASNVTISGGADNDSIDNYGSKVSINGDSGDDLINIAGGTNITINVAEGNDTISLTNDAIKINVEDFSSGDVILLSGSVSSIGTVKGGITADSVTIAGLNVASISTSWSLNGSNAHYLESYSEGVALSKDKNSITYKAQGEQDTLFTVSGVKATTGLALEDSVIVVSSNALNKKDITVNNGYGLSLANDVPLPEFTDEGWFNSNDNFAYKTASTIAGYQTVSSSEINYFKADGSNTLVELSGLSSEPNISGDAVVLSADNFSSNVAVVSNSNKYSFELTSDDYSGKIFTASSSADTITNSGSNIAINAGNASDLINNYSDNSSISAGNGNDSIYNYGPSTTISTGSGNDSISNFADNILFQHSSGNDIIDGFNSTSTLQISSTSISSAYLDGTDAFLTIGDNTITFKNFGDSTNIINLITANDTVSSQFTIPIRLGTDDSDFIQNENSNIMIQVLGSDDIVNNNGANVTVEGGADNDLIANYSDATKSLLQGQDGSDTISNDASSVIISGDAGSDSIINTGSKVSISGGAGNDSVELDNCSNVTVNVASGNDTIFVGSNVPRFTVQKFSSGDRIELAVAASEITSTKGGVKVDDNLTIIGPAASNITNQWSLDSGVAKYYQSRTAGVTLTDNNSAIVYTKAGSTDIFSISGVTSTDGISIDDNMVTVSKSALGTSNVSISGDYFLVLGDDVPAPEPVSEKWYINGTTATYRDISTLAGYTLEDNQIIYTAPTYGNTFIQLKGVSLPADGEGVIEGNSIMLTASNFAKNVTVANNNNGYDFYLGESDYSGKKFVGTSSGDFIYNNYGSNLLINSGAGADTIDNSGASATITTGNGDDSVATRDYGKNVKISTGAGKDTIYNEASYASINSGPSADYITNLGHSSIIDGGAGADSISNVSDLLDVSISGGTGNDYIDNAAVGAIINGDAGKDYIYNSGASVTINAGTGNDTIELNLAIGSDNRIEYNSGDGDDVVMISSYNSGAKILVDLQSGSIGGYSTTEENDFVVQVDDGSLTFKNAGGELIDIKTPEGENHIWNGIASTVIGGDDGVNIIDNKGVYVTVQSGAGNDTVTLSADEFSNNVYEYSRGKGKAYVYNYGASDKIRISDDSKVKVKIKGDDLNLKVGASSMTLIDAAKNQQTITVVNSKDETILSDTYTTAGKVKGEARAIELAENFSGTYTAENDIATVDGSQVVSKVQIIGNENYGNSIVGGACNDTLEGATFDDTLTGGKGSDVFTYKGGLDVITDYEKRDRINLENASPTVTSYEISNKELTLGMGSDSLTISGGADKVITLVQDRKRTRSIYTTAGIFDGKEKSVSLSGAESLFSAARYSKLITIDGSKVNDYLNIIGNSKKNYIMGSLGGTITGGKGKDTLIASGGTDVFIYDKGDGKDIINGYGAGDFVSLGSDVTIKDAKIKKGNSEIKVAGGSITINDTKTATLNFGGNDIYFDNGAFIDRTNSVVKVYGSYKDDIKLGSLGVSIADASDARRKLTITGSNSANSITSGKGKDKLYGGAGADSLVGGKGKDSLWGGAGNDTLSGGKGNDILYGDAGNDTFIFTAGDGVDTVAGYESGELLSIINKRGKEVDVTKSIFNEDKGTLTLSVKGGGKLTLTEVTSSTSVNINGTSKRISAL